MFCNYSTFWPYCFKRLQTPCKYCREESVRRAEAMFAALDSDGSGELTEVKFHLFFYHYDKL